MHICTLALSIRTKWWHCWCDSMHIHAHRETERLRGKGRCALIMNSVSYAPISRRCISFFSVVRVWKLLHHLVSFSSTHTHTHSFAVCLLCRLVDLSAVGLSANHASTLFLCPSSLAPSHTHPNAYIYGQKKWHFRSMDFKWSVSGMQKNHMHTFYINT